jgi:hypothetical protein
MKPGDLCRIVNPVWQQLSDSDVCMILKPVTNADGIDIYAECDWWVLWDSRETAWAASDLEVIDEGG